MNTNNIRNHCSPGVTVPRTLLVLLLLAIAAGSLNRAEAKPPDKDRGRSFISVHVFGGSTNAGDVATFDLFVFRDSRDSDVTVTVYYGSIDGSATVADGDYLPVSGMLTFAPGETHKTVSVQTLPDLFPEYEEYFWLRAAIVQRDGSLGYADADLFTIWGELQSFFPPWEWDEGPPINP
jgi:hypothetical protein